MLKVKFKSIIFVLIASSLTIHNTQADYDSKVVTTAQEKNYTEKIVKKIPLPILLPFIILYSALLDCRNVKDVCISAGCFSVLGAIAYLGRKISRENPYWLIAYVPMAALSACAVTIGSHLAKDPFNR